MKKRLRVRGASFDHYSASLLPPNRMQQSGLLAVDKLVEAFTVFARESESGNFITNRQIAIGSVFDGNKTSGWIDPHHTVQCVVILLPIEPKVRNAKYIISLIRASG